MSTPSFPRRAAALALTVATAAFVATRPGHWRVDLFALARRRLAGLGLHDVHGGGLCTIADASRFYSHRRDGRSGRLLGRIASVFYNLTASETHPALQAVLEDDDLSVEDSVAKAKIILAKRKP